jgi:beta-lactamase regulating signal transducer with metallopeptidase domain
MTYSLAGSLVLKVTLLLAVGLSIDQLLRRRWVLTVAALWNAVLLALLVLPLAAVLVPRLTLPLLPSNSHDANSSVNAADADPRTAATTGLRFREAGDAQPQESAVAATQIVQGVTFRLALAGIYFLGAATLLARLLAGWHAARSLRRDATPVRNSQWLERLEIWRTRLGRADKQAAAWTRRVTLLQSHQIDVPVVLGVTKPAILIPSSLLSNATTQAVDAILVHELAHVYRADCAWQLLDRVAQAALWLHPLIWIAERRIAFIRERACDDFAVRMVGDFRVYGETLLDIAAGITRRHSLGLGLTIVRSSNLERRLTAIVDSDGSNRCVAAPAARRLVTAGILVCAVGLASIGFSRAAADGAHASSGSSTSGSPATPRPELIAVTWQQVPQADDKRIEQPVWRPDGKRLTNAEANALLDQVKSFQTHWWNKEAGLRPLVFMFQRPPGIRGGLMTGIVLPDGRRMWMGSCFPLLSNGLSKSACSPSRADLKSWPAQVDLDVRIPLEEPQVFKTIVSLPEGAVEVAPGIRWYVGKEGGTDFLLPGMPEWRYTGGVLEIRDENFEAVIKYEARIWLRGSKQPVPEGIVFAVGEKPDAVIHMSAKIDKLRSIERVEFTRQRFRFERIKGVQTHLDLLPPE